LNDYLVSMLLGIVEGLTEFLPISSTAHLRIAEQVLRGPAILTDPYWKMYTIVIQLGAILALLLLFLPRIFEFVRTFPKGENGRNTVWDHPLTLTFIAFLCTAIPAKLLVKRVGENLENMKVIALALLIGGIVMWIVDAWAGRRDRTTGAGTNHVEQMSLVQAIWIGLCQVTSAVIPGTSRSMSTITAGQIAGMSRPSALEFSFLLSIPTMIAATLYSLLKALHPGLTEGADALTPLVMTGHGWIVLAIGFVVSFVVALGIVEWFLRWVRIHGFTVFAIYRILLGAGLLLWARHHLA